jgi:hypothetical protein
MLFSLHKISQKVADKTTKEKVRFKTFENQLHTTSLKINIS